MKVCICTLIKDEREYLRDWLKYNSDLGVDKIFIVEDIDSESHKDIIDEYDIAELLKIEHDTSNVDFQHHRQQYTQEKMFEYIKSLDEYDWCFIMDIDEYITITENKTLKELLSEYNNYSELMLYWKNYGANGHIDKPDYSKVNSYREYYTKPCWYSDDDLKYFYISKKGINMHKISPNYRVSQHLYSMVTYTNTNFQKGINKPCFDRMYISHYITKSWEEYVWKLLKRGMCCKNHRKIDDFFEMNTDMIPMKEKLIHDLENQEDSL